MAIKNINNSLTVENGAHTDIYFFDHKDYGNLLLRQCM